MPKMQDVFWDGFADEIEKVALGVKGKLGVAAAAAAGLAGLAGGSKKVKDGSVAQVTSANEGRAARINRMTSDE